MEPLSKLAQTNAAKNETDLQLHLRKLHPLGEISEGRNITSFNELRLTLVLGAAQRAFCVGAESFLLE